MGLIETVASLLGRRTKQEIERDQDFNEAIEKQANGTAELAAARAKLESCRTRIHARVAKIEATTKETAQRGRQESNPPA